MTPGEILVVLVLLGVVGLAVRSLWKSHRAGSHCTGDCASCCGCHGGQSAKQRRQQS